MIFQTFDKGFDGWTSKIGILGTSFHDLGTAIRTSFQSARDAVRNPDSSAGFLNTFRENLGSYTFNENEYKRNDDGDIITSQNIDAHIPKLTKEAADKRLDQLRTHQEKIQTGKAKSWSDLLPPEHEENKYLLDLVRHTEDLSDLTGNDLVEANQKARTAVLAHNEAIKAQTLSAKASKIALQGVATAGGMIAGFLIAKGIELAVTAIDNLIHREERLAEAAKEASENIQNSFSSFQSMKQSVSSITREFAELSQHVNQATGENIDLPEEEYQRFLELSNQLAETFPNIGYTIDENGNKITGLSGSIDEITQSINNLILAQQTLTHQDISDNMEDVYKKSYEDIKKNKEEIDNLNEEKIKIQDVQEATDKLLSGDSVDFQIKTQGDSMVYSDMVGMFQRVGMKLDFREGKLSLNSTAEESELSQEELDQLKKDAQKINELITADNKSIDKKIKKHQNKIQMSKDALAPEMISWLTTDQNYSNIVQSYGGELGTAIQKHVQTLDPTDPNIKKWDRMETWITDNLLAPLYDTDNEGLRQAYTQLFTDVNLPLDSAMNYLDEIEKYYEENEISIPVIFKEQKENLKQSKKNFDERNEQFKTGNVKGLNQFFQENSIDEADEYDKWCSVTEEITDATEAMEAWKRMKKSENQPSLSFQKSWDAIGTTGSDENKQSAQEAKEQLLELAQTGKLTEKAFSNSTIATQFMIDTGLSAEEATKKINNLVESTQQLSSMKIGMTAITSAYNEKKESEDRRVSFDTLESMRNTLGIDDSWSKKDMKVWKNYTQAATDANISLKDFKKCQDDLADSYINSGNFLANLTDKNQDHYDSLLMEMGITNAHQITTKLLADSKKYLGEQDEFSAKKGKSLTDATSDEIQKFIEAEGGANKVSNALLKLAIQKELCNDHVLDFSGDCTNLLNYVKSLGGTTKALRALQAAQNHDWKTVKELGYDPSDTSLISKLTGDVEKEIKKNRKKQVKTNTTAGNKSLDTDSNNNSPSSTKQSFDWLERTITTLTQKIDLLKAKLENMFSINAKNRNLNNQIKAVSKEIKAYSKEVSIYNKKAKKINLSKDLKKKINNGQLKGKSYGQFVKEYGEKDAQKIQKYMDLKDKAATAKQNKAQARKTKRDLKIQKHQNWVDYNDSVSSQYDVMIETVSTAKAKNKLEEDKLSYVEQSYNQQIKIAKLEQNSIKAATLLAQKWKEIAESRERILQHTLDENADKRDYNNTAYENADNAGKKGLIDINISSYDSDIDAHKENVTSAQEKVNDANSDVSKKAKAVTSQMKKEGLNKSTMKEIKSYISKGQKIPEIHLEGTKVMMPKLYQKLVAYNNSIDAAEFANNALAEAKKKQQTATEKIKTNKREEESKSIQLDIDAGNNQKDRLTAEYANLTTADAKNKNINAQLLQQAEIHNRTMDQLKNDITDPAERNVALAKEEAQWITTQREQSVLKLQNLADEQSAQYNLNQQMETNAEGAEEKNKCEAKSLEHLKSQYEYNIQIAKENGDFTEAERLRLEQEKKIEESYQRQIANIREEYNLIIDINNARKSTIDSKIAALQAYGYGTSKEMLQEQMELDKNSLQETIKQIERLSEKIPELSGDARKEAEKDLETEKQRFWEIHKNLGDTQQLINDFDLSNLERLFTMQGYNGKNLEYIQNILSHSDFTLSDKEIGGINMEGLASMAVTFAQIANNQEQIDNIYAQIAEKQRQLADSNIKKGDQLTEEINTLLQNAHDLEKTNYDFGESIKTLVMDSLNSLAEALDENISKYKDALRAQKDLYDYRKKVADQLKSIASLEKQLAALQGSDTEEARARIQKLQIQLEDEQQNLKDMEYEKYIQDQEELLDKVSNDFQDFISNVADMSVADICAAMRDAVTNNLSAIETAINGAFEKSSKISKLATSMDGLSEMIKKLIFHGNIATDVDENGDIHYDYIDKNGNQIDITVNNSDKPNTVTDFTVNGEPVPLPKKEIDKAQDALNEATSPLYPKEESNSTGSIKEMLVKWLYEQKRLNSLRYIKKIQLVNHVNDFQIIPSQIDPFHILTKNLVPLNTFVESITSLPNNPVPVRRSPASNTVVRSVDIHLDGSQVMDVETFIETLHNPKVLREVSNGVSSQVNTMMSNKLGNF